FQAEDGIRYRNVTGVQTCALPIWKKRAGREPCLDLRASGVQCFFSCEHRQRRPDRNRYLSGQSGAAEKGQYLPLRPVRRVRHPRSEERRVGKVCETTTQLIL